MVTRIRDISEPMVKCSFDPSLFMERAYDISPDPWQQEFLLLSPKRMLILCSRQSGKSTTCGALALHRATFSPNSLTLIVSIRMRQAQETLRKVKGGLDLVSRITGGVKYETQSMLEFPNGSRIIALPGGQESVRGFSNVSLVIIDEAAQVPDELYNSLRPVMAVSQGDLIALTTPWGQRGWFYNAWTGGDGIAWEKTKITAPECSRISAEFLEEERNSMGEWMFRQEYLCEFVDPQDQYFSHDMILNAITDEVQPLLFF